MSIEANALPLSQTANRHSVHYSTTLKQYTSVTDM